MIRSRSVLDDKGLEEILLIKEVERRIKLYEDTCEKLKNFKSAKKDKNDHKKQTKEYEKFMAVAKEENLNKLKTLLEKDFHDLKNITLRHFKTDKDEEINQ